MKKLRPVDPQELDNPLMRLVAEGRIRTLGDLKATYHRLVMKTHPDAVGSDRLQERFIQFSEHYEEARAFLAQETREPPDSVVPSNHRLEFYRQLRLVESLEMPYAFHAEENQALARTAKQRAAHELTAWKPEVVDLYVRADREYMLMKTEKPRGPYLKHALALNVRPVIYSIVAFQLTGQEVYGKQSRQNLGAIMQKLRERGFVSFQGFLEFLVEEVRNGAAVLE